MLTQMARPSHPGIYIILKNWYKSKGSFRPFTKGGLGLVVGIRLPNKRLSITEWARPQDSWAQNEQWFQQISYKLYWIFLYKSIYQSTQLLLLYNMMLGDWTAFSQWQIPFNYGSYPVGELITCFYYRNECLCFTQINLILYWKTVLWYGDSFCIDESNQLQNYILGTLGACINQSSVCSSVLQKCMHLTNVGIHRNNLCQENSCLPY